MEKPLKQYEVLNRASLFLKEYNREEAVAPLLLQHYLNVTRAVFYMRMREEVPSGVVCDFQDAIKRHAETGIPIAHITGAAAFYGRDFSVSDNVLIPRPETEELVAGVLDFVRDWTMPPTIVDIGTGSGIIAITLALELENADMYATDISTDALKIARKNAMALEGEVTFLQGDLLGPIGESGIQPDIIVSNPPYIAEQEAVELDDTVRAFDPEIALFAADNGLEIYKRLFQQLAQREDILPRLVAVEIGHEQGESVEQVAKEAFPKSIVRVQQDMNGKDRMVFVEMDV